MRRPKLDAQREHCLRLAAGRRRLGASREYFRLPEDRTVAMGASVIL